MKQMSLATTRFELVTKRTRKREFLDKMSLVVPWSELLSLIAPPAPAGRKGRPPYATDVMLRIHLLQHFFGRVDPAMEEALHDIPLYREFPNLNAGITRLPDESTTLRFRHLLGGHELGVQRLATVNARLIDRGLMLKAGTVADATLIAALSLTKNKSGQHDPEMHQSKKGNQWHFSMQAHIGVDADSGLVHTLTTTARNVHDVMHAHELLHGEEELVFADSRCLRVEKRDEVQGRHPDVDPQIAMMPSKRKAMKPDRRVDDLMDQIEKLKPRIRAKVDHPFWVIKRQFGNRMVRYRRMAKNTGQLLVLFALSNLWMVRRRLIQGLWA